MIFSYNHTVDFKADAVVVWLLVPVLDCLRLILTRIAKGVSPIAPDNNHLHHKLSLLLPRALVVLAILALVACSGALTVLLPD